MNSDGYLYRGYLAYFPESKLEGGRDCLPVGFCSDEPFAEERVSSVRGSATACFGFSLLLGQMDLIFLFRIPLSCSAEPEY